MSLFRELPDDVRIPELLIVGKEKFDDRIARVREGGNSPGQGAMMTFEQTASRADPQSDICLIKLSRNDSRSARPVHAA